MDLNLPPAVTARSVFECGGRMYSWADVVTAAHLRGSWRELEETALRGLACQHRLAASGDALIAGDVVAATTRFRHERNLLSGDELEQWLGHWGIPAAAWRDYFRRLLLRERWAGEVSETADRFPVSGEQLAPALWPEAVCSGLIERAAHRLAGDVALAAAAHEPIAGDRNHQLARIHTVADRARALVITDEAITREVASRRLEWLRIDGAVLDLPAEDVAREAAICIRVDGRTMAEMAAECGVQVTPLSVYMADLEGDLAPSLLAAREGELLGPLSRNGGFALLVVDRKVQPGVADPEIRRRASERVLSRAVERALSLYITWREPL